MHAFIVILTVAAAISAYFLFYKGDKKGFLIMSALMLKAGIIYLILGGGMAVQYIAFLAGTLYCFYFMASAGDIVRIRKEYYLALFVLLVSLVFFNGCAGKPEMPAVAGEIKLEFTPGEVYISQDDELIVGSLTGNTIKVFGGDLKEKYKIQAGGYPCDITKQDKKIISADRLSGTVTIYDTVSKETYNVSTGGQFPAAVVYDSKKGLIYAANMGSSRISVIDVAQKKVTGRIESGRWPSALFLSPDGKYLYITCKYTNTIEVAETEKRQIVFTRAQTGTSPVALLQMNKRELAVVNEWEYSYNGKGSVTVFDMAQYRITDSIIVPGGPSGGAVSRSKRHIFLSIPLKDEVVSVNIKTGQIEHTIKFDPGTLPGNMAFSKDGRKLFVASRKDNKLLVIQVNGLI
ncbi:MAG: hypothetical protein CVV21_03885 [Candidatus Goldiibacteriota bacterium HGW-Goldbacteria-1]|jgi:YVTN family beta-propeller protein|nr:MAG: hypothetical protein CVV21_03885 [Candidatus Goldiibacteriota bacterium HGW-Goldbacteria-1]